MYVRISYLHASLPCCPPNWYGCSCCCVFRVQALIENIATMVAEELPNNIKHLHDYTNEALDMEVTLRTRMAQLSPDKFEGVLHPAFQEDELKLILVGAALGVMVGFFQVFVVFAG